MTGIGAASLSSQVEIPCNVPETPAGTGGTRERRIELMPAGLLPGKAKPASAVLPAIGRSAARLHPARRCLYVLAGQRGSG